MSRRVLWSVGSLVALLGAGWAGGLRINLTTSLPFGVYRIVRGEQPRRSVIVLACLPHSVAAFARARGYVPRGGPCPEQTIPVGKVVLAAAGDTVTVTESGDLLLNGHLVPNARRRAHDRLGRPLPQLSAGLYVLGPQDLWLYSPSATSFDGRYFGPVSSTWVQAVVWPVWTVAPI
jgi:conjugative transfer signal peptidase TraF